MPRVMAALSAMPWSTTANAWQRSTCVSVVRSRTAWNLIPDGLPLGVLTSEVEFGQHAFEPVYHFGMASKPPIGAALVKKGFDLFHALLPSLLSVSHHRRAVRVFHLDPVTRQARPVGRAQSFRDDAFPPRG
jgi:hypothetical protein